MIPVVDPATGKTGYIDPKFAPEAQKTGLRKATDNELRDAQIVANKAATRADLDREYDGTIEGAVAPALAGAARGLSLGLSDVAAAQLGPGVRQKLLDYEEYAPGASLAGELGGIAGGALLGEEAGLGRLPGLVSKLGAGAEAAIMRGSGSALARVAGGAVRGAAEGAIYSAGKKAGELALRDEEMTAEKLIASGMHGAAFGAAAGAGIGAISAGVSRFSGAGRRVAGEEAAATSAIAPVAKEEATGLRGLLQKEADEKTIKALGGSSGDIAALERNVAGGHRRVAQDIRADLEASTGKSIGAHSRESLHEYAAARVDELGEKLGGMLKKLDDAGTGVAPDVKAFAAKVRQELVAPNTITLPNGVTVLKPGTKDIVNAAESWLGEVESAFGSKPPTFKEWHSARVNLQNQINFARAQASPTQGALKQIRGLMESELETSGEAAAQSMGSSFAGEYQATKSLYQSVKKAAELTERGVARQRANNSFGLGAMIGGAAGLVGGGPVAGVAMGLAGKLVKDRGDMLAADLLSRASNISAISGAVSRSNAAVTKGVESLLGAKVARIGELTAPKASGGFISQLLSSAGETTKAPVSAGASAGRQQFSRGAESLAALTGNPALLTERMGKMLGPVAETSPRIAAAATAKVAGDLQFLASRMPPTRQDPFSLQPQLQPTSRASDAEIAKYARYVQALDRPTVILDLAAKGTLTPDHVEAVKTRYPKMYEEMREQIFTGLMTSKSEVPYGKRIQLGILLDLPTDKTLSPEFVRAIQATYTASDKAGVEPPAPQLATLDVADSLMTSTQSAAAEGRTR